MAAASFLNPRNSLVHKQALFWTTLACSCFSAFSARFITPNELPLHTNGRYIVDKHGQRVKWACANWYGAYSPKHVVGGLEKQPIDSIVGKLRDFGFNCIRLCYSTQGQVTDPIIPDEDVAANPQFKGGKRHMEIFDATVKAITDAGMMVIINNHNHKSGWCCHHSQDEGLWFLPGYTEDLWVQSLVNMTRRYKNNPMVVGMDLRNEIHDYKDQHINWGEGGELDWHRAATRAGEAVQAENPDILVIVMALCFGMELRPMRDKIVELPVPHKIVYQAHNYLEYQFWYLIPQLLASWSALRILSIVFIIVSILLLYLCRYSWRRIGRPAPLPDCYIIMAGSWTTCLCFASAIFAHVLTAVAGTYCRISASRDVTPTIVVSWLFFAFGLIVAVVGCFRIRKAHAAALAEQPQVGEAVSYTPGDKPPRPEPIVFGDSGVEPSASHSSGKEKELKKPADSDPEEDDYSAPIQVARSTGFFGACCAPGWGSCRFAWDRVAGKERKSDKQPLPVVWDCGLCCGFQCCVCGWVTIVSMIGLFIFASFGPTYDFLESHLDGLWGFAMRQGEPFQAPVWMGEFGSSQRGVYWFNFMRYLSERDMDYAYWAVNGLKWAEGYIDTGSGEWVEYDEPRWENESFGIFNHDYSTVRQPWMLLELQALQESPSTYVPYGQPCTGDKSCN